MSMWLLWLIVAGIFFIGEIITVGFLVFWLGIGALLALIVSLFTTNVLIQTATFVISSIMLILATKPIVNKFFNKESIPTNIDTLKGKKAIVIEDINTTTGKGQVKIGGEVWSAICDENIVIPKDTEVTVVEIRGVKALVVPIKTSITQN